MKLKGMKETLPKAKNKGMPISIIMMVANITEMFKMESFTALEYSPDPKKMEKHKPI